MPLTPKQQRFVEEYLVDLNATQAAVRAGYSAKTAHSIGDENLRKPEIKTALDAAMAARSDRTQVTADRVVRELAKIAFTDRRDLFDWGPTGVVVKASAELPADVAAVVTEVSQTVTEAGGTIRVKTADKVQALRLLGEHLGLFVEKVEHSGGMTQTHIYLPAKDDHPPAAG